MDRLLDSLASISIPEVRTQLLFQKAVCAALQIPQGKAIIPGTGLGVQVGS